MEIKRAVRILVILRLQITVLEAMQLVSLLNAFSRTLSRESCRDKSYYKQESRERKGSLW